MKYNNCIICSIGSSGSYFLTNILRQDNNWNVYLEYINHKHPEINLSEAQSLLNVDNVCYINGLSRYYFRDLSVKYKVVLIRNPYTLALSWYNKKNGLNKRWIDLFNYDLKHLNNCYEESDMVLFYEEITTSKRPILNLADMVGMSIKEIDLQNKVNSNKYTHAKEYKDLPKEFRIHLENKVDWFKQKFYGNS